MGECYRMMFMEPQRKNRLIAAPGNTLSNWSFFFTSNLLFARLQRDDPFFVPDLMGASVGMILAVASTLWHSTNSAAVHYVDLCFMYVVMLFIPCSILAHTYPSEITVPILVAVEVLIVVTLMIYYKALYERKEYHEVFILAFRQDLLRNGDKAPRMIKMCLFFAIPVLLLWFVIPDGYLALVMRTNAAHDLPQLCASVDVTPLIWCALFTN